MGTPNEGFGRNSIAFDCTTELAQYHCATAMQFCQEENFGAIWWLLAGSLPGGCLGDGRDHVVHAESAKSRSLNRRHLLIQGDGSEVQATDGAHGAFRRGRFDETHDGISHLLGMGAIRRIEECREVSDKVIVQAG